MLMYWGQKDPEDGVQQGYHMNIVRNDWGEWTGYVSIRRAGEARKIDVSLIDDLQVAQVRKQICSDGLKTWWNGTKINWRKAKAGEE